MEQNTQKKRRKTFVTAVVAVVVVGILGIVWFVEARKYETTDNAQIDGNIVAIRSSVTAYVDKINFTDNQQVEKGQLLVVFDTTKLQQNFIQVESSFENAKANKSIVEADIEEAQNDVASLTSKAEAVHQNVIAAQANLDKTKSNYVRISELLKIKGATDEQLDAVQASLKVAQSEYDKANNNWHSALLELKNSKLQVEIQNNALKQAIASVTQYQAELKLARYDLDHAFIKAPCGGIVTKRAINIGEFVSAGQSLFLIVDNNNIWVSANFKEIDLSSIKKGQPVNVEVDTYPDLHITGKVASVSGATGSKFTLLPPDNATGNFIKVTQQVPVRILLDPLTPDIQKLLLPGLSAFVKIQIHE